jgi:drug/metabolite transporter (DMT)-like permease
MTPRAWLYFLLVTILWGVPYFFIKIALHDVSPPVVVFIRVAIGAVVLVPVVLVRGGFSRLRGRVVPLAGFGLLEVVAPFLLISFGEQRISSSLTGILIATEPMFISLLALRFDHSERSGGRQLAGMLIGLAGVVVLLGLNAQGEGWVAGATMILLATACYACGALIIKNYLSDISPLTVAAGGLGGSAVILALPAALALPSTAPSGGTVAALLILGIACTGAGFIAFFTLIAEAGARRASFITYVSPVVAVSLGVAAAGERFTLTTAIGLVLILLGSLFGTIGGSRVDAADADTGPIPEGGVPA